MTNDASRAVGEDDGQLEQDSQKDEARPSLADWLVIPLRQSQRPSPVESEPAASTSEPPSPEERFLNSEPAEAEGALLESSAEAEAAQEGTDELTPQTLSPQVIPDEKEQENEQEEEDDGEESVIPFTTAIPGGRRALYVVLASLVAVAALLVVGRWIIGRRSAPTKTAHVAPIVAPAAASLLLRAPADIASTNPPPIQKESEQSPESSNSTMRSASALSPRPSPADTAISSPLVAPAWSIARFPDLPRDVLIACEQAAEQPSSVPSSAPGEPALDPLAPRR